MTILELREKRNTAWNAAKAFLDSHRTEKGTLTAEDDATYSRMEQEIADLGKEIARLERQEALEAELNKPVNKPLTSKPVTVAEKPAKTGRASDEYKTGMLQALRTNFRQVSNILQEGVDADGGYLVPEEYDHRLIDVLNEENIMRKLGHKITTSGEHKTNIAATKPAAAWIEEGGALLVRKPERNPPMPVLWSMILRLISLSATVRKLQRSPLLNTGCSLEASYTTSWL